MLSVMVTLYLNLGKSIRAIGAEVLILAEIRNENVLVWNKQQKGYLKDLHTDHKMPGEVLKAATITYYYHKVCNQ